MTSRSLLLWAQRAINQPTAVQQKSLEPWIFRLTLGMGGNSVVETAVESVQPIENGERLRRFHNPNSS